MKKYNVRLMVPDVGAEELAAVRRERNAHLDSEWEA